MKFFGELRRAGAHLRRAMRAAAALMDRGQAAAPASSGAVDATHSVVADFGSNPGRLRMFVHTPALPPALGNPLIVILHGCTQGATNFAPEAGWTVLSDRLGIPLVLPQQLQDNNRARCFNWFNPSDARRGSGELLSIRQMVAHASRRFGSDPGRIFIVGLSAGGAMAAAALTAYPDVFAAGAVIAGLPVGCAGSMSEGLSRMARAGNDLTMDRLVARARASGRAGYTGPWPRISIWHGGRDQAVDPANSELLALQWTGLHGLTGKPREEEAVPGVARRRFWGADSDPPVELWTIPGMDHGYPIDSVSGDGAHPSRWVLDAGVSATARIARFWRIA